MLADSFEVALLRDDGTKRKIWLGETASGVWRKVLMDVHAAQEKMAKEVGDQHSSGVAIVTAIFR